MKRSGELHLKEKWNNGPSSSDAALVAERSNGVATLENGNENVKSKFSTQDVLHGGIFRRPLPLVRRNQSSTPRAPPEKPKNPIVVSAHSSSGTAVRGNSDLFTPSEPDVKKVRFRTPLFTVEEFYGSTSRRTLPLEGKKQNSTLVSILMKPEDFAVPVRDARGIDSATNGSHENELISLRQRYAVMREQYRSLAKQAKLFKCFDKDINRYCRIKSACTTPIVCKTRKQMKRNLIELLNEKRKVKLRGKDAAVDNIPPISPATNTEVGDEVQDNVIAVNKDVINVKDDVVSVKENVSTVEKDAITGKDTVISVKETVPTAEDDDVTVKDDVIAVKDNVVSVNDEEEHDVILEDPFIEDDAITNDISQEKEKLARGNKLKASKIELIQEPHWKLERRKSDEAIREQSRKRLMNLLEKSKFYADFMKKTLERSKQKCSRLWRQLLSVEEEKARSSRSMLAYYGKGGRQLKTTLSLDAPKPEIDVDSTNKKRRLGAEYSEDLLETIQKKKKYENEALEHVNEIDPVSSSESLASATSQELVAATPRKPGTRLTPLGIEVHEDQPLLLEGAALRQYQIEGVNWLIDLYEKGMNGILADEMGLGKTIQTIALICHLYANGVCGPFLIVAPLSTLPNWIHELQTFAPKLPAVLYHGSEEKRKSLAPSLKAESELLGKKVLPVVVTSYEVPTRDYSTLSKITWSFISVDEGHKIKNYKTALARTLTSMRSVNRLLLTGTPLQNDLTELWSLLHFILPEVFNDLDIFETLFTAKELTQNQTMDLCLEKEDKGSILSLLHEVLTPFLLRRLKSDVGMNIPAKKEILVHCPMTGTQLDLYKAVLDETILLFNRDAQRRVSHLEVHIKQKKRYSKLRDPSECESPFEPEVADESEVRVFGTSGFQYKLKILMTAPFIELIKILNHPYLIHPKVLPGSCYLQVDEEIVQCSGKMAMLDGLLARLKARGHRVLVFSTYTQMLDLIEDFANMRGYQWRRLDGSTGIDDRRSFMGEFNTDPNIFMFLLSTRAGGLGINLTGADTVIIFNSDWNPQVDLQAQDRCHRIGQTKPVVVYRFITPGTYDGRILTRAESKRKLEKMILQKGKFKHGSAGKQDIQLTLQELKTLLNEKQHNLEIQPNGTTLTDQQWEVLLDRSDLLDKRD